MYSTAIAKLMSIKVCLFCVLGPYPYPFSYLYFSSLSLCRPLFYSLVNQILTSWEKNRNCFKVANLKQLKIITPSLAPEHEKCCGVRNSHPCMCRKFSGVIILASI